MDQIIRVAWDLNENTDNRYQLVYEIAELAKKLVDENQAKKARDEVRMVMISILKKTLTQHTKKKILLNTQLWLKQQKLMTTD